MHGFSSALQSKSVSAFRARKFVSLVVLVSVLLLFAGSNLYAQAWWFGKNKVQYRDFEWEVLRTPHFDINFPRGYRDLAVKTAVILEYGYTKLSADFSHQIKWRIPVIVYGSHSAFQQTNVTWSLIPEGVQAFADPLRKRMVLHFGGSNSDYIHTVVHELVHIFTFDMVYGSLLQSIFSRNFLFQIPLWFAEGTAEYYSVGYDKTAEMFMRDATVYDYLMNLDEAGGYMVYKSGQAAIHYLVQTYGPEKIIEIMDHLKYQRSMDLALRSSIGITTSELSKEWKKFLRRKYWPVYADKKDVEDIAVKLTDHMKKHHYMNTKPAISPDGEYIVYFSDLKGLDGIYLMNAVTGKVVKRLITGSISTKFESIRSMKSSLAFSPDGSRVAFVAKSHGFDKLFIMKVPGGKIDKIIGIPLDFFYSPSWSPTGDELVFVGVEKGQTDLYLYDLSQNKLSRLTNDPQDEENPSWTPDGSKVVFARYPVEIIQPLFEKDSTGVERLVGIDYSSPDNVKMLDSDIWSIDMGSMKLERIISTPGNDNDPIVLPGGREIVFTSDESGISNLYIGSIGVGSYYRFTDVLGGIFSPSYSAQADRLVFSAFNSAGFDIYVMHDFIENSKNSYSAGGPTIVHVEGEENVSLPEVSVVSDRAISSDSTVASVSGETDLEYGVETGSLERPGRSVPERRRERVSGRIVQPGKAPDVVVDEDSDEGMNPDTLEAIREKVRKEVGTVQPYHVKFAPDYIGNAAGLFYSTGFGFGLMNQIAFSDLLGDHHLYIFFNIYRSIEDSDIMISYYYLKKRIDYAFGVFQYKNYLSSRVSSVGETFLDYRSFTERNYGLYGLVSFPFSTFTRMDLEFEGFISERQFFSYAVAGENGDELYFYPSERSSRRLFQPSLSFVHDSAYFNMFGPVIGSRWMVSVSRTLSFSGSDVSRATAFFDYRKYFPLFYRNYLAFRTMGAVSTGEDRRYFFLGGPLTMRGYDYLQFSGPKMLLFNLEYRYPLIDAIIFGWPGRWGFRNIGGTFFIDSGTVWGENMFYDPEPSNVDPTIINDLKFYSDFGVGFYLNFGYLILNFQIGWPTDFTRTGGAVFHFFLGPMF